MEAWLIALISTAATTAVTYLTQFSIREIIKYKQNKAKKLDAMSLALQSILRHELETDAKTYFIRGYITPLECKKWNEDYERYHALGANGVMTTCKDEINKLEIKEKPND